MGLEVINELKKKKGWTNEDLAGCSGVPKATIDKITAGTTGNPSFDTVQAIADALGCTVDTFAKKSLETECQPVGEEQEEFERFCRAFVQLGFVRAGEDFTDLQLSVLGGMMEILDAVFPRDARGQQGARTAG